jgi:hypothetical protein
LAVFRLRRVVMPQTTTALSADRHKGAAGSAMTVSERSRQILSKDVITSASLQVKDAPIEACRRECAALPIVV